MSYISIKNLSVIFGRNKFFNNITLNIEKGSLTSVTTPSSKGKTTFLNLICGNINRNCRWRETCQRWNVSGDRANTKL